MGADVSHTPGPWRWVESSVDDWFLQGHAQDVLWVSGTPGRDDRALIAAAPDLYGTLVSIASSVYDDSLMDDPERELLRVKRLAESAIAEARGEA